MDGPSAHLTWVEMACRDAVKTPYPVTWRPGRAVALAAVFESIRAACGDRPIVVLSAFRTPAHNRSVGGARHSQHLNGRALDLRPPSGMTVREFHDLILAMAQEPGSPIRGLGYYAAHRFVHVDIRPEMRLARWTGAGAKDA